MKKVDEADIRYQYLDMEIDIWCHTSPKIVLVLTNEEYLLELNSLGANFNYMQYTTKNNSVRDFWATSDFNTAAMFSQPIGFLLHYYL